MDRGAWWATVHGVGKSQTRLSDSQLQFRKSQASCLQLPRSRALRPETSPLLQGRGSLQRGLKARFRAEVAFTPRPGLRNPDCFLCSLEPPCSWIRDVTGGTVVSDTCSPVTLLCSSSAT